ncbi:molybdenum ABC transporter ATP-binding protein [Gallaecimonas pentaromativorans]|uniref:molybdenum ABC transporter ATP-binding protein n=1 Tax=Gallaecimonas pentaromativorans TaxID=584787 RepID=UPI003A91F247
MSKYGIEARFALGLTGKGESAFNLDVDLTLPGQGVSAIFGHSGSGKTTLLRCLAGLERAPVGRLKVNGDTWQDQGLFLKTHKRPLGYVFQESSLFPHLTAKGNLDYATKRSGKATPEALYQKVLAVMGIEPLLGRYPHQLSGGERQRVAIARALLIQPSLLLMDEPLAALDMARKQEILPYLEKLRTSFALPVVYVSHAMDEVARLADHVVVMQGGKVKAEGAVGEVFSRLDLPLPAGDDASVVWQGQLAERDSQWHLAKVACPGGALWVRDNGDALGGPVRLRVQARDVSLSLSRHSDSSILNLLAVEVEQMVPDKDDAMVLVRLKAQNDHLIARLTRRSASTLALQPGQSLWAQIKSVAIVR